MEQNCGILWCTLSPDLFNTYFEHIMRKDLAGMENNGARGNGRIINNLRFTDDIGLMAELLDQAQLLLDRVDESVQNKDKRLANLRQNDAF